MKGSPRAYSLTAAGYRITDLMRAGVVSMEGVPASPRRAPIKPTCPQCRAVVKLTPTRLVRRHRHNGLQCLGTGRQVTR